MSSRPLVELQNISKSYPGVKALDDVSISFYGGEVHAIMGENGAGKSTLMKILSGAQQPDEGRILVKGSESRFVDPMHSKRSGIGMIYQELTVLENLDVGRNLLLGAEPLTRLGLVDWAALYGRAQEILDEFNLQLDVKASLGTLSVGQQQMVEIARVASQKPRIIIMDEPTSALGREEEEVLFDLIKQLKDRNVAIAYVSHRMDEVFDLSDRITVLRDGRHIYTKGIDEVDRGSVIEAMVGRHVEENYGRLLERSDTSDEIALEVKDLSDGRSFSSVSFTLGKGEVLGIAGLVGSGRTELFESIFGLRAYTEGTIVVDGNVVTGSSPRDRMDAGIAYVPEDRKRLGLVLAQSLAFNLSLAAIERVSRWGFRVPSIIEKLYEEWREQLGIRATSGSQIVETLSGGNQQKVLLAKWLARNPKVLVLNEPTRGVDVGAKSEVHRIIREVAGTGVGVVVISSELPEILTVSDRVLVMWRGAVTGNLRREEATEQAIVSLAFGETEQRRTEGV